MSAWPPAPALRLPRWRTNLATILGIELLAACQGIEFHRPLHSSRAAGGGACGWCASVAAPWDQDRVMAPDIEAAKAPGRARPFAALAPWH